MGGADAPSSAAEGADHAIWLATTDIAQRGTENVTGVLWEDHQVIPW